MIVETDFLSHWKTNSLIDALDDPAAPCYLLHLWAHCQTRKEYRFDSDKLTPKILKRITRCPADAQTLWDAFIDIGFLDLHEDGTVEAHGFYDANSKLFANWENGKKGGRPKKKSAPEKPEKNPNETQPEPIEERERGEEIEEAEKQDEGEKDDESSVSPSPCDLGFWFGKPYGNVKRQVIRSYDELHVMNDPIEAAMAVTGDYSLGMYGFLVKSCKKSREVGLSPATIHKWLFEEVGKILGEINAGERERGKEAASGLTARMKEYFTALDQPDSQSYVA